MHGRGERATARPQRRRRPRPVRWEQRHRGTPRERRQPERENIPGTNSLLCVACVERRDGTTGRDLCHFKLEVDTSKLLETAKQP